MCVWGGGACPESVLGSIHESVSPWWYPWVCQSLALSISLSVLGSIHESAGACRGCQVQGKSEGICCSLGDCSLLTACCTLQTINNKVLNPSNSLRGCFSGLQDMCIQNLEKRLQVIRPCMWWLHSPLTKLYTALTTYRAVHCTHHLQSFTLYCYLLSFTSDVLLSVQCILMLLILTKGGQCTDLSSMLVSSPHLLRSRCLHEFCLSRDHYSTFAWAGTTILILP